MKKIIFMMIMAVTASESFAMNAYEGQGWTDKIKELIRKLFSRHKHKGNISSTTPPTETGKQNPPENVQHETTETGTETGTEIGAGAETGTEIGAGAQQSPENVQQRQQESPENVQQQESPENVQQKQQESVPIAELKPADSSKDDEKRLQLVQLLTEIKRLEELYHRLQTRAHAKRKSLRTAAAGAAGAAPQATFPEQSSPVEFLRNNYPQYASLQEPRNYAELKNLFLKFWDDAGNERPSYNELFTSENENLKKEARDALWAIYMPFRVYSMRLQRPMRRLRNIQKAFRDVSPGALLDFDQILYHAPENYVRWVLRYLEQTPECFHYTNAPSYCN